MDTEYYYVCPYITIIGRGKSCQITKKKWGREKQTAKILIVNQHQIKDMHFKTSQEFECLRNRCQ